MTDRKGINRRHFLGAGVALPLTALAAQAETPAACGVTPRQTSGPFYPIFDQVDKDVDLTRLTGHDRSARGEHIRVQGRILDSSCTPVAGALVDLWQADSNGRYTHPADPNPARPDANFQGWGQTVTDAEGRYSFKTIKPASYPMEFLGDKADPSAGYRTPHIHFRVSKRGYVELATQMYFAGEKLNDIDIVLNKVAAADRHKVVITAAKSTTDDLPLFGFDITIARI